MFIVHELPIVVGWDGTETSTPAVTWAADEAATRHAPLVVVRVFDPRDETTLHSGSAARMTAALDALLDRDDELVGRAGVGPVERVFEVGAPGRVLVDRSRGARMLVLGQARRHHQIEGGSYRPGPALGSVARACVAYTACPVVIVPEPITDKAADVSSARLRHAPLRGRRALYPFQGRIPVAHH